MRFGSFALDVAAETLERDGRRVRLTGQPLRVLLLLVASAGQIVSRDQLRDELWGRETFVDFEQGLNTAVNKLRQALGDSADRPVYVETVPGRGYRFVAPIRQDDEQPHDADANEPAKTSGWRLSGRLGLATALVALLILPWALDRPSRRGSESNTFSAPSTTSTQFTVEPPPGFWLEPAFTRQGFDVSPDGTSLVLTARGPDGRLHAWRRDLSDVALHPIPNAESAQTVFWGPASRRLFFAVGKSLRVGDARGGPSRVLSEDTEVLHGAVLSTDRVLVTGNRQISTLVPLEGGAPQRLSEPLPWPVPLPDDQHLLYLAFGESAYESVVRSTTIGGSRDEGSDLVRTRSRAEFAPSADDPLEGHLLYVRGGTLLAQPFDVRTMSLSGEAVPLASGVHHFASSGAADFAVSASGVLVYQPYLGRAQLVWLNRKDEVVGRVGAPDQGIYHVSVSPDERRIAAELYSVKDGYTRLWVFDAASGNGRPITDQLAGGAVWAPDSTRMVFSGIALGELPQLRVRDVTEEGYGEPVLPGIHPEQLQIPTDWSLDGRYVVYDSRLEGDVWIADLVDGTTEPLLASPAHEAAGMLSPGGARLAFISDETGRPEVYLQTFDASREPQLSGERRRLSSNGALSLRWSPDGKEILFAGADGRMHVVDVQDAEAPGAPVALFALDLEATTPMITPFSFAVSRDGRRLLVPRLTNPQRRRLVVVKNWPALLPR